MATLVERMTRYTVLVQLPRSRTIDEPNEALEAAVGSMPEPLIRTLTWDQGEEVAGHENVAAATGLDVFVCDRSSPWQRGTNENANGLLRQWWPRSTNFYTLERPSNGSRQPGPSNSPSVEADGPPSSVEGLHPYMPLSRGPAGEASRDYRAASTRRQTLSLAEQASRCGTSGTGTLGQSQHPRLLPGLRTSEPISRWLNPCVDRRTTSSLHER
jgi:hypothetical protein